jgi:serine/threonine protein kinase
VIQALTNNDPHIVQIKPAIALERVFGLDFNAILNILGPLTEPQALYFFKPLVNTLILMHMANLHVLDIKAENLICSVKRGRVVIQYLDFGFSHIGEAAAIINSFWRGSEPYMAPEIQERRPYRAIEVDLFALGVLLYSMVTLEYPFQQQLAHDYNFNLIRNG